jgi:hypothetical protein
LNLTRESLLTKLPARNRVPEPGSCRKLDAHLEQLASELADRQAHCLMGAFAQTLNSTGNRVYATSLMASVVRRKLSELAQQLKAKSDRVEPINATSPPDRSASDSPRPTDNHQPVSASSQPLELDRMRHYQSWCDLRGAYHIARSIGSRLACVSEQVQELARQIRQLRANWTRNLARDEKGAAEGNLIEWGQTQMVAWVQALDKQSTEQLQRTGMSVDSLLGQSPENVSRQLDHLRYVACRIVEAALLQHSLRHSTHAKDSDADTEPFQRLLDDAVPMLTTCGGRQRWGTILPPDASSLRDRIQQQIRQETGHAGYEINDPTGNLLVCCHLSHVPVDNCIRALIGTRRQLIPLAERLHARNDLSWSPLV